MDYTYLDYFNYYLKEFLNELINTFPETRDAIIANYRPLLEGRDDKNDLYVKCYYTKINNFLEPIAKKDATLFETPSKIFIEGVDLHFVWNSQHANETNRTAIWKYLQILMILGRKNIPNHKEIVDMLNKVSNGNVIVPAKVEKTLTSDSKDDTDETPSVFGLGDIASSLGGLSSLVSGLTGGGEGGAGIGDLMGGLTSMFSNPDFTNAMSQLSQSMAAASTTDGEQASGEQADGDVVEGCEATGECASAVEGEAATPTQQPTTGAAPQLFNNPLFGELAEEIGKTFNFEDMEKGGKPANIGEALGRFMSGNNPQKLMGLVGKFGAKLQDEVKKGNVNPAELLAQTMGAAGGPQNLANMMNNPQVKARMTNMQKQNATRDRLRAKLEKKNAEKNNE
jgi:hypothetical protein